jgi:phage repressor protein C with HTH and peptisase S24 domain
MEKSSTIVIETRHNFGSSFRGVEPGEKIKAERERRGWSQADLAHRVGISQVAVKKIEGGETKQSKYLPRVCLELGLDLAEVDPTLSRKSDPLDKGDILDRRSDFAIYAAAEGGPGEIIVSSDPVDWHPRPQPLANVKDAYGLYVVGNSMAPEYRPGDIALVNPNLPVVGDEVYIFYAEREGEARATIKHLRRALADKWFVSQHNKPKDFELSRKEWQWAHRVIGKYSRQ